MPIKYGQGWTPEAGGGIRTRLPGQVTKEVIGEQARDADDAFGAIPRMQLREVLNQPWQPPLFVTFEWKPKMILMQAMRADDQDLFVACGAVGTWRWLGDKAEITYTPFLTAGPAPFNWVFLGVG